MNPPSPVILVPAFLFANGDNTTKYHVTLDFTQQLLDKLGVVVPMSDCRKMYMVFAPRFENVEQDLRDGCFLTAGVGTSHTTWTVDDTSKLTGGRYSYQGGVVAPCASSGTSAARALLGNYRDAPISTIMGYGG